MFTGIVEEIGSIISISKGAKSAVLTIKGHKVLSDAKIGHSICVNGICLTITTINSNVFTVDAMPETIKSSSLATLKTGSSINLERAMKVNDRFGGHIVSGHIDGIGKIISITKDDNAFWYKIGANYDILKYIVKKGSITIDGISLTIAELEKTSFSVSIIPHTLSETILNNKNVGDIVNLENDIVSKYIERFLNVQNESKALSLQTNTNITRNFLAKNGF